MKQYAWIKVADGRERYVCVSDDAPPAERKAKVGTIVRDVEHVSGSLPRAHQVHIPGLDYVKDRKSKDFGKYIIKNMEDVRRVQSATGLVHGRSGSTRGSDWDIKSDFAERGRA